MGKYQRPQKCQAEDVTFEMFGIFDGVINCACALSWLSAEPGHRYFRALSQNVCLYKMIIYPKVLAEMQL